MLELSSVHCSDHRQARHPAQEHHQWVLGVGFWALGEILGSGYGILSSWYGILGSGLWVLAATPQAPRTGSASFLHRVQGERGQS